MREEKRNHLRLVAPPPKKMPTENALTILARKDPEVREFLKLISEHRLRELAVEKLEAKTGWSDC